MQRRTSMIADLSRDCRMAYMSGRQEILSAKTAELLTQVQLPKSATAALTEFLSTRACRCIGKSGCSILKNERADRARYVFKLLFHAPRSATLSKISLALDIMRTKYKDKYVLMLTSILLKPSRKYPEQILSMALNIAAFAAIKSQESMHQLDVTAGCLLKEDLGRRVVETTTSNTFITPRLDPLPSSPLIAVAMPAMNDALQGSMIQTEASKLIRDSSHPVIAIGEAVTTAAEFSNYQAQQYSKALIVESTECKDSISNSAQRTYTLQPGDYPTPQSHDRAEPHYNLMSSAPLIRMSSAGAAMAANTIVKNLDFNLVEDGHHELADLAGDRRRPASNKPAPTSAEGDSSAITSLRDLEDSDSADQSDLLTQEEESSPKSDHEEAPRDVHQGQVVTSIPDEFCPTVHTQQPVDEIQDIVSETRTPVDVTLQNSSLVTVANISGDSSISHVEREHQPDVVGEVCEASSHGELENHVADVTVEPEAHSAEPPLHQSNTDQFITVQECRSDVSSASATERMSLIVEDSINDEPSSKAEELATNPPVDAPISVATVQSNESPTEPSLTVDEQDLGAKEVIQIVQTQAGEGAHTTQPHVSHDDVKDADGNEGDLVDAKVATRQLMALDAALNGPDVVLRQRQADEDLAHEGESNRLQPLESQFESENIILPPPAFSLGKDNSVDPETHDALMNSKGSSVEIIDIEDIKARSEAKKPEAPATLCPAEAPADSTSSQGVDTAPPAARPFPISDSVPPDVTDPSCPDSHIAEPSDPSAAKAAPSTGAHQVAPVATRCGNLDPQEPHVEAEAPTPILFTAESGTDSAVGELRANSSRDSEIEDSSKAVAVADSQEAASVEISQKSEGAEDHVVEASDALDITQYSHISIHSHSESATEAGAAASVAAADVPGVPPQDDIFPVTNELEIAKENTDLAAMLATYVEEAQEERPTMEHSLEAEQYGHSLSAANKLAMRQPPINYAIEAEVMQPEVSTCKKEYGSTVPDFDHAAAVVVSQREASTPRDIAIEAEENVREGAGEVDSSKGDLECPFDPINSLSSDGAVKDSATLRTEEQLCSSTSSQISPNKTESIEVDKSESRADGDVTSEVRELDAQPQREITQQSQNSHDTNLKGETIQSNHLRDAIEAEQAEHAEKPELLTPTQDVVPQEGSNLLSKPMTFGVSSAEGSVVDAKPSREAEEGESLRNVDARSESDISNQQSSSLHEAASKSAKNTVDSDSRDCAGEIRLARQASEAGKKQSEDERQSQESSPYETLIGAKRDIAEQESPEGRREVACAGETSVFEAASLTEVTSETHDDAPMGLGSSASEPTEPSDVTSVRSSLPKTECVINLLGREDVTEVNPSSLENEDKSLCYSKEGPLLGATAPCHPAEMSDGEKRDSLSEARSDQGAQRLITENTLTVTRARGLTHSASCVVASATHSSRSLSHQASVPLPEYCGKSWRTADCRSEEGAQASFAAVAAAASAAAAVAISSTPQYTPNLSFVQEGEDLILRSTNFRSSAPVDHDSCASEVRHPLGFVVPLETDQPILVAAREGSDSDSWADSAVAIEDEREMMKEVELANLSPRKPSIASAIGYSDAHTHSHSSISTPRILTETQFLQSSQEDDEHEGAPRTDVPEAGVGSIDVHQREGSVSESAEGIKISARNQDESSQGLSKCSGAPRIQVHNRLAEIVIPAHVTPRTADQLEALMEVDIVLSKAKADVWHNQLKYLHGNTFMMSHGRNISAQVALSLVKTAMTSSSDRKADTAAPVAETTGNFS